MKFILAFALVAMAGCGEHEIFGPSEKRLADCKAKGGFLVTNTRPAHGQPSFVCVKPL